MIHLCTCIEGSASNSALCRKRAATCMICGGKQLVNGRESLPGSMLSTVDLELTSLINSDLTWKKASKGRSASRRTRKPISKAGGELVNKDPKRVAMPISESEKLGVSVLEYRFHEKAEHIPIKKRRFFLRSPSPNSSPRCEDTERTIKKQHSSGLDFPSDLTPRCQLMATDDAAADLGKIVDTGLDCDRKSLVQVNEFPGDNEDFSGISILTTAAYGSSMGGDGFEVGFSRDGASSTHGGPLEVLEHNESCSLSKGFSMEDFVSSDKISTKEAGLSTFPVAEEVLAAPSFHKGPAYGHNTSMPDSFVTVSQDLLRSNDDVTTGTHESSLRDDCSHWDLNAAMDARVQPFEYQCCSSQLIAGDSIYGDVDDDKHEDKVEMSKGCDLQSEADSINGKMRHPSDLNVLTQAHELNIEEPGFDSGSGLNGPVCLQEKLVSSSEIINASKTDLPQEVESLQNQGRIRPDSGSAVSVPVERDRGSTGNVENLSLLNLASLDSCPDNSLSPNSNNLTSMCISEDDNLAVSSGIVIVNCRNNYAAERPKDSNIPSISEAETQEATPLVSFLEKSTCESMDILKDAEIHERKLSLFGDVHVHEYVMGLGTGMVQSVCDGSENAVCKLDEVNFSQSSPTCAEIPRYEALLGGQPVVAVDAKEQHAVVSVDGPDGNDAPMHIDMRDLTKCSGKSAEIFGASSGFSSHGECMSSSIDLVDYPDKLAGCGYDSDVSQNDLCPVADIEKKGETQMDYDSHYEDGELRETIAYTWEDLGGEDGEGEDVDCGSDNKDMAGFGASDYHVMLVKVEGGECKRKKVSSTKNLGSEPEQSFPGTLSMRNVEEAVSGEEDGAKCYSPCLFSWFSGRDHIGRFDASAEIAKETGAGPDNVIGDHKIHVIEDDTREANEQDDSKMKNSGCDLLPENCKGSCDMAKELQDGSGRKNIYCDYSDVLNTEYTETRIAKSRAFKRELLSEIEGPVSGDVFLGKHTLYTQGHKSNDATDSNSRSERGSGSTKPFGKNGYSLHVHSRAQPSEQWTDYPDGHGGSRGHNSSGYRSITGFSFQLPENVTALFTSRQRTSVSSHGMRRALTRSRSPSERDEAFGMRLGLRTAGEISPDKRMGIRERYLNYGPRLDDKGSRGRYDGHVLDVSNESSLNYSYPLAKREKSFSPIDRRGDPSTCWSHTKSPSRSRSHSPNAWQSPRGRNGTGVSGNPCLRHRSRSPNFWSGARVHRIRSPHQRSGFASDHMVGLMSMPRNHVSSPHNSRLIGNRKDEPVYFKEHDSKQRSSVLYKRSPGRICPRDERFALVDSQKLKPNVYYRSMRPGRFSVMDGVARGPRYAGSDDDRKKHGCRNGLVQPARRYEMDRSVKRFRYDIEDGGFVAAHSLCKKDGADLHGRSPKDYTKGIDSRIGDIPRRSREEKGPFLSTQDAKYNADS